MGSETRAWERRYKRKLLVTDILIVFASIFAAQVIRFGTVLTELQIPLHDHNMFELAYSLISVAVALVWLIALGLSGSRSTTVIGTGPTEYKRVANSTLYAFGLLAITAFIFKAPIGRGYLTIALPIGLLLLLIGRWGWRKRLHRQRTRGKNTYRTLIVGERLKSVHVSTAAEF